MEKGDLVLFDGMVCRISAEADNSMILVHEDTGSKFDSILSYWVQPDEVIPLTEVEATFHRLKRAA